MNWALLLFALISIESPVSEEAARNAIEREGAYGCLQIRQICLDDVNQQQGTEYTLQDLENSEALSRWVCVHYLRYWGGVYRNKTGKEPGYEVYARIWNGGPVGYRKKSTEAYWNKVQEVLRK